MATQEPINYEKLAKTIGEVIADQMTMAMRELSGSKTTSTSTGKEVFFQTATKHGISESEARSMYEGLPNDLQKRWLGSEKNISEIPRNKFRSIQNETQERERSLEEYGKLIRSYESPSPFVGRVKEDTQNYEETRRRIDELKPRIPNFLVKESLFDQHAEERHFFAGSRGVRTNWAMGKLGRAQEQIGMDEVLRLLGEGDVQKAAGRLSRNILSTRSGKVAAGLVGAGPAINVANRALERTYMQSAGMSRQLGLGAGVGGDQGWGGGIGDTIASAYAWPMLFAGGLPDQMNIPGMSKAATEGFSMRSRAARKGLNPFDLVSQRESLNIVTQVSRRGFRPSTQMKVEDALIDIVNNTAIDVNTALNIIDVGIKRLGLDAKEAKDVLLAMGGQARNAGKDISEFAQETFSVMQTITAQGGKGQGALTASTFISSIPQVSGDRVSQVLNSPTIQALTASSYLTGGNLTNENATYFALGNQYAAGNPIDIMEQNLTQIQGLVKQFKPLMGNAAYGAVANIIGANPFEVEQIDRFGGKMVKQARAISAAQSGAEAIEAYSKGMINKGLNTKGAQMGFETMQSLYKAKNIPGAMKFSSIGIEGTGKDFESSVKKYANALISGDSEQQEKILKEINENRDLDTQSVVEAADLFSKAMRGDREAFNQLSKKNNLSVKGPVGKDIWNSSEWQNIEKYPKDFWKNLDSTESKKVKELINTTLRSAEQGGIVDKWTRSDLFKQVTTGEISPQELTRELQERTMDLKSMNEGKQVVTLSNDARKLLKFLRPNPNSKQDYNIDEFMSRG